MKNLLCSQGWEVPSGWPVLLGCIRPSCVTHGWALTLSGVRLPSGHHSKRLCPQLAWPTVCSGAVQLDKCLALGWGRQAPGAAGEDSPQWVCQESLAYHWPVRFWASPCSHPTARPGGCTFPCSTLARAFSAASKNPQFLGSTENGPLLPLGGTSGSEASRACLWGPLCCSLGLCAWVCHSVLPTTRSWLSSRGSGSDWRTPRLGPSPGSGSTRGEGPGGSPGSCVLPDLRSVVGSPTPPRAPADVGMLPLLQAGLFPKLFPEMQGSGQGCLLEEAITGHFLSREQLGDAAASRLAPPKELLLLSSPTGAPCPSEPPRRQHSYTPRRVPPQDSWPPHGAYSPIPVHWLEVRCLVWGPHVTHRRP